MKVPAEQVREQIVSIFSAWGMDAGLVRTAAEVMVETDLMGVDSHGVSMLMDYDDARRKGKLNLMASPKVVRQNGVDMPSASMLALSALERTRERCGA
jgi:LDH2 family malate/lactate/ureidoglycolate dehydrogenase